MFIPASFYDWHHWWLPSGGRAVNPAMFIVARAITGFVTRQTFRPDAYFSEVTPPNSRSLMAGAHRCFPRPTLTVSLM